MGETKGYIVAGEFKSAEETFEVKSPFDGDVVAVVATPTGSDI
jgi:hypothetical protein